MEVELQAATVASRDYAATWQAEAGQVVAITWGGTMCWFPRKPGTLRIEHEGFQHIIRCGECPGCIEFDRRRLADRLLAQYPDRSQTLWVARIYCRLESQTSVSHNLHRRPATDLEKGFYRLGVSSFAVIVRSKSGLGRALRRLGLAHRFERIYLRRGRRAWRSITAGLTVSRSAYGPQVKRYYCRGLPRAEKLSWSRVKMSYQKGYSRLSSPRVWTSNNLVLIPPAVWRLRRNDRRQIRELLRKAADPESVTRVINLVSALTAKLAPQLTAIAAPQERPSREQTQAWYKRYAEQLAASASSASALKILPPLSEVGGYVSSEHTTSTDKPKLLSDEELAAPGPSGRPRWQERELERLRLLPQRKAAKRAKLQAEIEEWPAKMERLAKERDRGG